MKYAFSVLLVLALSVSAWCAPTVQDTASGQSSSASTTQNITITTTSGATFLWVPCLLYNEPTNTITAGTFDGVSMTAIAGSETRFNSNQYIKFFGLVNPHIGASLTVTMTASGSSNWQCQAITFANADTSTPYAGVANSGSTGLFGDPTITVSCASTNLSVDFVYLQSGSNPVISGTGHTVALQPVPNNTGWGSGYTAATTNPTLSWINPMGMFVASSVAMCVNATSGGGGTKKCILGGGLICQ